MPRVATKKPRTKVVRELVIGAQSIVLEIELGRSLAMPISSAAISTCRALGTHEQIFLGAAGINF